MTLDGQDGVYKGVEGVKETDSNVRSSDEESNTKPVTSSKSKSRDDPFGNEENSEVKYKTMTWW